MTDRFRADQEYLKFIFRKRIPKRYHDHATHSSCSGGGLIVYIWEYERASKMGIKDDPWVEIGAIIQQYFMRDDVSGCEPVYKQNPEYPEGTGGGLSPEKLRTIITAVDNKSEWQYMSDGEEYTFEDVLSQIG